ncbi:MAG: thermonuclease family protein [Rhodospirillales bacterium]
MRVERVLLHSALWLALAGFAAALYGHATRAAETLSGPVRARVLQVIDGDTLAVQARIWLGQDVDILVRLVGIDAPELKGKCAAEREAALAARETLAALAALGEVTLSEIRYDKYGGRVLARVAARDGTDLAGALLARRLARPYDGKARMGWCG